MTNHKPGSGTKDRSQNSPVESSDVDLKKAERFWNASFERLKHHIDSENPVNGEGATKQR